MRRLLHYWCVRVRVRVHARAQSPLPPCLDLFSNLLHYFVHVPAGVAWEAQQLAMLLLLGCIAAFGLRRSILVSRF